MSFKPVARIVGVHGLKGYLKLDLLTDHPQCLAQGQRLRMDGEWVTVRATTLHQDRLLIQLDNFRDRTKAEALRGKTLEAQDELPKLGEGEFLVRELVGCSVVTTDGEQIGCVDDVLPYPAQDLLVIGSTLIPFVHEFVKDVDLDQRRVTVAPIPGMILESEAIE
jgi:16S rRNA processing protein RimM